MWQAGVILTDTLGSAPFGEPLAEEDPLGLQTPEEESLGCRQILAAMDCKAGVSSAAEAAPMPAGFLESFAEQFEQESLPEIVSTLGDIAKLSIPCCSNRKKQVRSFEVLYTPILNP